MDPLQWMGAIRMRVQTADKNIIIIHTHPPIQSCEAKSYVEIKKQIILLILKDESIIHNNASFSEKVNHLLSLT